MTTHEQDEGDAGRKEGLQNPLTDTGGAPDREGDANARADEKVDVVQPDGRPAPRAKPSGDRGLVRRAEA
jgi:hypothetical protein